MARRSVTDLQRGKVLAVVGLVAVGCAACFVLLTVYAGIRGSATNVDLDVQHAFLDHRGSTLTAFARTLTFLGSTPELYVGLVAGALVARWLDYAGAGRRGGSARLPLYCLLWFVAGQLLRTGINQVIDRPRPVQALHLTGAAGDAFPSGHTASATMAYGLVVLLVAAYAQRRRTVVCTALVAVVVAIGVGLSRIYLGVHWPTDVAAGWCFGIFWLCAGTALFLVGGAARRPDYSSQT